jgi:hypothetical protein
MLLAAMAVAPSQLFAASTLNSQEGPGTVVLMLESSYFAPDASRIKALAEILAQQRGANRIVAYAIGSGETHQLWDAENASTPPDVESMEGALRRFAEKTAGNHRIYSLLHFLERIELAMKGHAENFHKRYGSGLLRPPGDESFRLRLLIAAQAIALSLARAPKKTCADEASPGWPESLVSPHRLKDPGENDPRPQEVEAFWVYEATGPQREELSRAVENFFYAGFDRDGIALRGVYYLQDPMEPRERRPQQAPAPPSSAPPCAYLTEQQLKHREFLKARSRPSIAQAPQPNPAQPPSPPQAPAPGPQTQPAPAQQTSGPQAAKQSPAPTSPPQPTGGPQAAKQSQAPTPPPQPSAGPPPSRTANCQPPAERSLVDQFVAGTDLTNPNLQKLYAIWDRIDCHIWTIIAAGNRPSSERARALKLLRLAVAHQGVGSWQPAGSRRGRREFSQTLPYLQPNDYEAIFELMQLNDPELQREALIFIRSYPVDRFEALFHGAFVRTAQLDRKIVERIASAAAFLYYNRIVEFLYEIPASGENLSSDQKDHALKSMAADRSKGFEWTEDSKFTNGNGKAYRAMLYYALGLVEHEKKLKPAQVAKENYESMLNTLGQGAVVYPTNPLHIAQALAFRYGNDQDIAILQRVKNADRTSEVFLDQLGLQAGTKVDLYAGPGKQFPKLNRQVEVAGGVPVVLQLKDWDLIQSHDAVGWVQSNLHP